VNCTGIQATIQNLWLLLGKTYPLSNEDIEKELRSLKNRKSPGPDGIFNEMLKYGGTELTLHLTQLFQQIFKLCTIPKAWKQSTSIPLFKKGSKTNPDNYRGITLLNTILKLFTKVILHKFFNICSLERNSRASDKIGQQQMLFL